MCTFIVRVAVQPNMKVVDCGSADNCTRGWRFHWFIQNLYRSNARFWQYISSDTVFHDDLLHFFLHYANFTNHFAPDFHLKSCIITRALTSGSIQKDWSCHYEYINKQTSSQFMIITDSLSSLQALASQKSDNIKHFALISLHVPTEKYCLLLGS